MNPLARLLGRLRPDPKPEPDGRWRSCHACGLPAVCFGADLADPKLRCPRHCRAETASRHGDPNHMAGHAPAEGVSP